MAGKNARKNFYAVRRGRDAPASAFSVCPLLPPLGSFVLFWNAPLAHARVFTFHFPLRLVHCAAAMYSLSNLGRGQVKSARVLRRSI